MIDTSFDGMKTRIVTKGLESVLWDIPVDLALGSHRCPTSCGWALLSNPGVPTVESPGSDSDSNSALAGHRHQAIAEVDLGVDGRH